MRKFLYPVVIISSLQLAACDNSNRDAVETASAPVVSKPSAKPAVVPEQPIDTQAAMLDRGRVLYKRCVSCHTLEQGGRNRVGPNLYGVIGAKAGNKDGFVYSTAMKSSNIIWTDENLASYLANPRKFMPKNKMSFAGLRKPEDQAAVIAYIKEKTGS